MIDRIMDFMKKKKVASFLYWVEKVSGLLLIVIGILILTDTLILLNNYFDFLNFAQIL